MRFLHGLSTLALFLFNAALAAAAFYYAMDASSWSGVTADLQTIRLSVIGGALALACLLLIYLLTFLRRREPIQYITFDSPAGQVSISVRAVRDFIHRAIGEFPAVVTDYPRLRVRRGAVEFDIDLHVRSGTHVPELCEAIQEKVMQAAHEQLGISDINGVRVHVREIVGDVGKQGSPVPSSHLEK